MNILIPAAGAGRRFKEAGYKQPKPLIDVGGKPMLFQVIDNVTPSGKTSNRRWTLMLNGPVGTPWHSSMPWPMNTTIRPVMGLTDGAARTALLADFAINTDDPLLIANSDQLIDWPKGSVDDFIARARPYDGAVVLFEADGNPKWSYASFDVELSRITRIAEKDPISKYATAGIYYWKHGRDFVRSAEQMIAKDIRTNGEFYIAPTYNELIAESADIMPYIIPSNAMHGLGTPEDLEAYLASR